MGLPAHLFEKGQKATRLPFDQIINGVGWDGQNMRQIQLMAS